MIGDEDRVLVFALFDAGWRLVWAGDLDGARVAWRAQAAVLRAAILNARKEKP